MAHLLFVDESGQDHKASPYEVLAGVAVQDRELWNLILAVQDAERRYFGKRYTEGDREIKASTLLKPKTFRLARQMESFAEPQLQQLAYEALEEPTRPTRERLTALGQAKLCYVHAVLDICASFRCKAFASIIAQPDAGTARRDLLRKDYSYLFERFFYFLEDQGPEQQGIVVFDQIEKTASHLLVGQMDRYFKQTTKGKARAAQILPEPLFVRSDLTTGVQLADLVAYLISWGFRIDRLAKPGRNELDPFVQQVCNLRYQAVRHEPHPDFKIWSFAVIDSLAPTA